jgi:hypothetical protein
MAAIATGRQDTLILNVRNRSTLPSLDAAAVIEVPCAVDANGAKPLATAPLTDHEAGLVSSVNAAERATIEIRHLAIAAGHRPPPACRLGQAIYATSTPLSLEMWQAPGEPVLARKSSLHR